MTDFAFVLAFDGVKDAGFANAWTALKRESIASDQIDFNYAPHISFVSANVPDDHSVDVDALIRKAEPLAAKWKVFPLHFEDVTVLFKGASAALLARPRRREKLHPWQASIAKFWLPAAPYQAPEVWVPHATLTKDIPTSRVGRAVEVLSAVWTPFAATPDRAEFLRVEKGCSPVVLWSFKL